MTIDNEILAYNVGEFYFSNRNLEEAITYYGTAIRIKPDWSLPYYRLGLVYLNKEDYSNAEANFRKFLEIDPGSELAGSVRSMLEYLEKIKRQGFLKTFPRPEAQRGPGRCAPRSLLPNSPGRA
ncbi:MAG: tetratricopeptide repeat protein [Candidatus Aminicenantes bacterium]|nr:MAG: tetratricopeptide repeat protein [Candidatus Aminicenantes bacterium]